MSHPKYHYALWMIAGFCLAFTLGSSVAKKEIEASSEDDLYVLEMMYKRAVQEPDEYVREYFKLLEQDRYSRHAHASILGLVLADAFSTERSGVVYVRAMHEMDEPNIRQFVLQTYDRFMENDRAVYESSEVKFPDTVEKSIHTMFSNRPVFMFSPREKIALTDCKNKALSEGLSTSFSLREFFGDYSDNGCKVLMEIHNNNHL